MLVKLFNIGKQDKIYVKQTPISIKTVEKCREVNSFTQIKIINRIIQNLYSYILQRMLIDQEVPQPI